MHAGEIAARDSVTASCVKIPATPADLLPSDAFLGLTLAAGHLKLYVQWEGARTKVLHGLAAENNRITHQIEYRSVELEKFEDQVRAEAVAH